MSARPRIRTLKPEFFRSSKVLRLGVGARYVAVGLISMVDDRGRAQRLVPAMRSYVFPAGEVGEKQVEKALDEIEAVRFAWRYEADGFSYLWLPGFWEHQWLNRPTESKLPPHPDDPYGGLPIKEAIERYKNDHRDDTENSQSRNGELKPRVGARVGTRSVPVPLPEELLPHLEKAFEVLEGLAARHGAKSVNRDALANVIAARPRKPLVRAAHDCAAWWDGQARQLRDVVSAYRNWLDKTDDLAAVEVLGAGARVVPLQRAAALQRADAWLAHYPEEAS